MSATTFNMATACTYCGGYHAATCPRVKVIEYHASGGVKSIELHPVEVMPASPVVPLTALREHIAGQRRCRPHYDVAPVVQYRKGMEVQLDALAALLDEYERTPDA